MNLNVERAIAATLMFPIFFLGFTVPLAFAVAQVPGSFTPTGDMPNVHSFHSATLLLNGQVLIAGGLGPLSGRSSVSTANAELFNPATGAFTPTGNLTAARVGHTATLLPNGKVLIAGGSSYDGHRSTGLATAELYDPITGKFSTTSDMTSTRADHTATLLPNGKVLIAGGGLRGGQYDPITSAELYDPTTEAFVATGNLNTARVDHTATLLPNGKVLVSGGYGDLLILRSAEVYDSATGTFAATADLAMPFWADGVAGHTATLLLNGQVLIAGGECDECGPVDIAEVYDSATGIFTNTGNMSARRRSHTATLLPDGTALISGGVCTLTASTDFCLPASAAAKIDLFDPPSDLFTVKGYMTGPRLGHTATLMPNGTVLIAGGYEGEGLRSAELYSPSVLKPAPVLFSLSGDVQGQGAVLHAGTHQIVSSSNPAVAGEALEIYCTGLAQDSVIPPQVAIGGQLAETLFFGKAPAFADLNQVNVRVPSGVKPGPAVPVRVNYLGRPSNEVSIGLR